MIISERDGKTLYRYRNQFKAPFGALGSTAQRVVAGGIPEREAQASLKWGMPAGTYPDPEGRLSGEGKSGRHLKLTRVDELPRSAVRAWLRTAAEQARARR